MQSENMHVNSQAAFVGISQSLLEKLGLETLLWGASHGLVGGSHGGGGL